VIPENGLGGEKGCRNDSRPDLQPAANEKIEEDESDLEGDEVRQMPSRREVQPEKFQYILKLACNHQVGWSASDMITRGRAE
jgi:hypothetical protein